MILPIQSVELNTTDQASVQQLLPEIPHTVRDFGQILERVRLSCVCRASYQNSIIQRIILSHGLRDDVIDIIIRREPVKIQRFSGIHIFTKLRVVQEQPIVSQIIITALVQ